jgi:hypothetical protein
MTKRVTIFLASLLWVARASGAPFACGTDSPSLASITLDMSLQEVQRKLGSGKLVARAPNPGLNDNSYYEWRIGAADIRVTLDVGNRVVSIVYSSRSMVKPYDNVILNSDTITSIKRKFGPPATKVGPVFSEGEIVIYHVLYRCGPDSAHEIAFMAAALSCARPDMDTCLLESAFASRKIVGVALRRRTKSD